MMRKTSFKRCHLDSLIKLSMKQHQDLLKENKKSRTISKENTSSISYSESSFFKGSLISQPWWSWNLVLLWTNIDNRSWLASSSVLSFSRWHWGAAGPSSFGLRLETSLELSATFVNRTHSIWGSMTTLRIVTSRCWLEKQVWSSLSHIFWFRRLKSWKRSLVLAKRIFLSSSKVFQVT